MELHIPSVGIAYGARYLASKLERYHGDTTMAVAAYNAGSARFSRDQYVNQGYVDAVIENLRSLQGVAMPTIGIALVVGLYLAYRASQHGQS